MNAAEVTRITKTYPSFTLKDVSLTLPSGMIMGLVGENGAGKTTLIKSMLGLVKPDSGTVSLLERGNPSEHKELFEEIGIVLDNVRYPIHMTMPEISRMMKEIYRSWDEELYLKLCQELDVPMDTRFGKLSRGNMMKACIIAALSHHPKLLLLDEATSGLDPVARDQMLDLLLEFTRDEDHSVLMSSHIVSDLEKACDLIMFLHKGEVLLSEEKDVLKESCGVVQMTKEELDALDSKDVIGSRITPYGAEVILRREAVPEGKTAEPVDLEELFVLMIKGERK